MTELTEESVRQQYRYYAFISYSRKDEKWAEWLQNRLETYRLPAAIRKNNIDIPRKICPVFRDKTDLSGIVLEEAMQPELEASKYLIVICSPQSARSEYVNREIAHFLSLGREKAIIPFIVDGEPFSRDPERECFPQALRDMQSELLGIGVPELGRRNAFLRLVSTLLNLRYDQVVMRDTRRRARRSAILAAAALVLSVVLGAAIWYNTPHVKYYNAYVYQNEVPVGIYELSASERKVSHDHYRITTQQGKVRKVECVNSAGLPDAPAVTIATYEYPILEFHYDEQGTLSSVDQKDHYGLLVSTKVLSYGGANEIAVDFKRSGDSLDVYTMSSDMTYLASGGGEAENKSEITRLRNTYDQNGFLVRSLYQKDNLGTPACDSNGVYGKLYEYNDLGQVLRVSNLDAGGNVSSCRYGWATVEYTYDDRGNYIMECYYDAENAPVRNEKGSYYESVFYDENNNLTIWQALDENGQPFVTTEGFAEQRAEYDDNGLLTSVAHFDAQGAPVYSQDGYHEIRYEYNAQHRCISNSYYDINSEPMYVPGYSCASIHVELNDAGQTVLLWTYGTDGSPTCDMDTGAYIFRYEYDENGYPNAVYFLDAQGALTMTKYGYASKHSEYDSAGNELRTEYRDENGDLVRGAENVAVIVRTYDDFGNWTNVRYYDENEEPCYHADGYMGADYAYENGNLTLIRYVDAQGEPMLCPEGYCDCRQEYENGNCVRVTYYGPQGQKVLHQDGYHEVRWEYENDQLVRSAYYDTDGGLVSHEHGYAVVEYSRDVHGNATETCYYGEDLEPALLDGDYYRITREYDQRGNKLSETVYTFDDTSLPYQTGVYEYDSYNNVVHALYYDCNGDLIEGSADYPAEKRLAYDATGNETLYETLDGDGLPLKHDDPTFVNRQENQYDEYGNLILQRSLHVDRSGQETCLYQNRNAYDERGNLIRLDYLDGEGNLEAQDDGAASYCIGYTATGELSWMERYDADNEPIEPLFRIEYEYDEFGSRVKRIAYDAEGNYLGETSS